MVDWHDSHDHRRNLQLCRILVHGCDPGHSARRSQCRYYNDIERHLSQGATELCRQDRMLQLYNWVCDHPTQCARAVKCRDYSRNAVLCYRSGVSFLHGRDCRRLCDHCALGGPKIREEEHVGLSQCLLVDWRTERGGHSRAWCGDTVPDQWQRSYTIQALVSLRFAGICSGNSTD